MIHEEVDTVTRLSTTETLVDVLRRRYGKGRSLFIVKRAETKQISTSFLEHHVVFDHILHLGGVKDLGYGTLCYQFNNAF